MRTCDKKRFATSASAATTKSLAALQDVYASGDAGVKEQVLQAWMIAGRKEQVYQAAVNAKSEAEANAAISMLGVMGAVDELRKLSDRPNVGTGLGGCAMRSAAISRACARSSTAAATSRLRQRGCSQDRHRRQRSRTDCFARDLQEQSRAEITRRPPCKVC